MDSSDSIVSDRRMTAGGLTAKHRPEYNTWKEMKRRCYNPSASYYHRYGGRGVTICQRWLDSFANFLADMGKKPSQQHSIDRIDNDGNYEPSNCRWATSTEQAQNTTCAKRVTFNGETMSISAWARKIGIDDSALSNRLRRGWALEKALTTPPTPPSMSGGAILLTHDGETMTLQEWSRKLSIQPATILARIKKLGWSVEKALTTPTRQHK